MCRLSAPAGTPRPVTSPLPIAPPAAFKAFVQSSFAYLNRHPDVPRFVTIACFNEWSEGHYLLPDNRFGYGMLNALGEAVGKRELNQIRGK